MNMLGKFELGFYMEDSSQKEMEDIFDDIAEQVEAILDDYEIVSVDDFQMTQECFPVKNRVCALMEIEDSPEGETLMESLKEIAGRIKQFFTKKKVEG